MSNASQRESMEYDVVIIGAGPSGLATAIRLQQLATENNQDISICILEKGAEVGAHILSGAVIEPRALTELFPNWQELGAPLNAAVTGDEVHFFTSDQNSINMPGFMIPPSMHNKGNFIVSLGNVCRWLGEQAEQLGIEIYPGFAAAELLYNDDGSVKGVATPDMGINAKGEKTDQYEPGMELHAKITVFAEGCRGQLGKELIEKFNLAEESDAQHYAIGFKELWEVKPENHKLGTVVHGAGWPLKDAVGGSYLYHLENNQVSIGLFVDLNYSNPHLSPYDEFQRMKHHPVFANVLKGGKRISYGARAATKGGANSLIKMHMPGALIVGCDAGTLNFSKIKGIHTAMKSGIVAAESLLDYFKNGAADSNDLAGYQDAFKQSWAGKELRKSRNFGPALHKYGPFFGGAFNYIDQVFFRGMMPITLRDTKEDHAQLKNVSECEKIDYPKPDGELSFDKLSSVFLSNTFHEEDQPCHLTLKDSDIPIKTNLPQYDAPEQRYCPAGVYEIVEENGNPKLQINGQNCIHCKTCDIKDPTQNIVWVAPQGGGGPIYPNM